ncbi:MAG: ABC transporter permease [Chitinispirillaceae bacterium]|nr:ABC transporter permease [Chitinispirillaceae bacterium]
MDKETAILLPKIVDREWVSRSAPLLKSRERLVLDFSAVSAIDPAGRFFIQLLRTSRGNQQSLLVIRNIVPALLDDLRRAYAPPAPDRKKSGSASPLRAAAAGAIKNARTTLSSALSVLVEMLYWGTLGVLREQHFRKGTLAEQMFLLGYKALGIVALLSFLIGMVLALQAAIQLKAYGAGVFLGPLIGITMVREMGPLLTAIILAGRTGSATTAEIGTMVVGEEIDALRTMGINPVQFVVVPKFWAITLTMPLLSILATVAGILGGFCIGAIYLDLASNLYWGELSKALFFRDVLAGFIKSVAFSWLIIWIGAFYGFRVRGGAESVGRETTSSVVACIFIIIIADALFSFVL